MAKDESTDLCENCAQKCRLRLLIIDSQIEALGTERKALQKTLSELEQQIDNLRALYQINMRVLNIVNAPIKTGEEHEADFVARFTRG